jgi:hypothetical protein
VKPIPTALRGTAWEIWLRDAPDTDVDENGDAFYGAARNWLGNHPGGNSRPDDVQLNALADWASRYQILLLSQMIEEPGLGEDRLVLAFWSTVGGVAGASVVAKLGLAATTLAGPFVAGGLGVLAAGFAAASILRNARKSRRQRMIKGICLELQRVIQQSQAN